jgi:TonB family protein
MDRRINWSIHRVHVLALCVGSVLSIASSAQDAQPNPSEEPVMTQSPDPRGLMRVAFIEPRSREVTTVAFAQAGDAGTARVQACTDAKGKITKALLMESSGNPRVDSVATTVVSLSQFSPGIVKGKPRAACTVVPVTITAPKTAAEIEGLPDPWKGGKPPTVAFIPSSMPRPSGMVVQALTAVCVDGGSKTISVTLAVSSGDKTKDREMVELARQFMISPGVVDGKRVASCLLLPV